MDKPYKNSGLFSDHYLSDILPRRPEWEVSSEKLKEVFDKIKTLYQSKKDELPKLSEASLEERFIRPILRTHLDHIYEVQSGIPHTIEGTKKPDYAFFPDEETRTAALKAKTREELFSEAVAVGEAKQWGRPLDKKLKIARDPFEIQNPSLQMSRYLWLTGVKWGILTDGQFWRLYERETSKRIDIYYEIDLPVLLEQGTVEDFKYFYIFFNKEAFVRGPDEKCLLDKIYQGSVDYREGVSGELKANVYQALRILAEGFLKNPVNNLSPDYLQEIHNNSLVFLYRLLFILYAEHRNLLPMDNSIYRDSYSLYALKQEIAEKIDTKAALSQTMSHYHGKIKELFEVINVGNKELGVPPYNGGLFDPEKHEFLEEYRVGDAYLALVIDLLSRSKDKAFVDYSSLEIRHLGSIYEGLLEYKLKIADEDMVAIKEKGKEKWMPATKAGGAKIFDEAKTGEIYLTTDKGERKATGSYYTPDYIVEYIIQNTLGPLINEKKKLVQQKINELKEKIKSSRGYNREQYEKQLRNAENSLIDEILALKVLDPAMGSGHFLVEATDYIAHALVGVLSGEVSPEEEKEKVVSEVKETAPTYSVEIMEEEDIRWARREVIERCIFGVDLNPLAVELAKLSLWLSTVAKDKPLSFLDHHLRCGNSLIGAKIDDLAVLPTLKKGKTKEIDQGQLALFDESAFKLDIGRAVKDFHFIEAKASDCIEDVRDKEKIYKELWEARLEKWKRIADLWTSIYFGTETNRTLYQALTDKLLGKSVYLPGGTEAFLEKAEQLAEEKCFFHWEIEFPEIFFDEFGRKLDNPGFDAVAGNPPYQRIQGLQAVDPAQVDYYGIKYRSATRNYDIYVLMAEQGCHLLKRQGTLGFIQPHKVFQSSFGEGFRRFGSENHLLKRIIHFNANQIFPEATTYTCLLFLAGSKQDTYELALVPQLNDVGQELPKYLSEHLKFTNKNSADLTVEPWVLTDAETGDILTKIAGANPPLIDFAEKVFQGLATSADKIYFLDMVEDHGNMVLAHSTQLGRDILLERAILKPVLKGDDVHRYEPPTPTKWVIFPYDLSAGQPRLYSENELSSQFPNIWKYLKENETALRARENGRMDGPNWWAYIYPKNLNQFDKPKLITPEISHGCNMTFDVVGVAHTTTVYGFVFRAANYSDYHWLAILNSCLLWYFLKSTGYVLRGGYFRFKTDYLAPFPIRRIAFTTPTRARQEKLKKAKVFYEEYLLSDNWSEILDFVGKLLEKKHEADPELVRKHNDDPLSKDRQMPEDALWEQSDVVHDILAYLTEQMIEMNKVKQAEIKGFLEWLEREIGAKIDDLTNKTKIKAYHEHTLEDLLNVLKHIRRALKVNLSRDFQEKLKSEFEKSLAELTPLKEKIADTDWLIDQIVYKLYGLTDEEIKIIEESFGKTANENQN